jgi:ankyrin repeat protein
MIANFLYAMTAGCIGVAIALSGILAVAVVQRRFAKLLTVSLVLNALVGPIPLLHDAYAEWSWRNPPLVRAVKSGDMLRLKKTLASRGVPVEADAEGYEALCVAVQADRFDMIEALVDAYATSKSGGFAVTHSEALVLSAWYGHAGLVKELLKAGADPNASPHAGRPSALASAVGDADMLRVMLKAGANPTNGLGPALDYCFRLRTVAIDINGKEVGAPNPDSKAEEVLKVLLDNGADPNAATPPANWTPLAIAVNGHRLGAVRILLDHGAEPNDPGNPFNLLETAERGNDSEIARLLRERAAKPPPKPK